MSSAGFLYRETTRKWPRPASNQTWSYLYLCLPYQSQTLGFHKEILGGVNKRRKMRAAW